MSKTLEERIEEIRGNCFLKDHSQLILAEIRHESKNLGQYKELMDKYYVNLDDTYERGKNISEHMRSLDASFEELLKDDKYDYDSCMDVLYYINLYYSMEQMDVGYRILATIMSYTTTYIGGGFYDVILRTKLYLTCENKKDFFTIDELDMCLNDW